MHTVDWIVLAVLALSGLLGLIRGFVREVISLVAWLLGLWLAWKFAYLIEPHLGGVLAHAGVSLWVSRLIILVGVLLIAALVGFILSHFVRHSPFGGLDHGFGFFFGLIRGAVILGVAVIVCELLKLDGETWWQSSKLIPYVQFLGEWIRHLVSDFKPAAESAMAML